MKQKLWKQIVALALAGTMTLALGACGNGTDGNSSVSDSSSAEEEKKEESAPAESTQESVETEEGDGEEASGLEWLHPASIPMVDEGVEKKLSMYILSSEGAGNAEDVWMYKYIEGALNIDLEVTRFTDANKSEFLSLAFASGELPDIIIGGDFDPAALVKYGMVEGQILDLGPYLNET